MWPKDLPRRGRADAGGTTAMRERGGSRASTRLGGFFGVPPPQARESRNTIFRQRIGMAEAVPARIALKSVGELRNDVAVPQQHPVHRLATRGELGVVLGVNDAIDQGIDRGILDAGNVAASGPIRRLRAEEIALFIARRHRL